MALATQPQTERRTAVQAEPTAPSPILFFETIRAFLQSAALKTAIDLEIFTAIAEGAETAEAIAKHTAASPRGVRIVCDGNQEPGTNSLPFPPSDPVLSRAH